ncbi:MAG: hypothetical protein H6757_04615 [Candidatus Omnitrophica bacterium]|nr:hypothetical protein [Candidatus Omnitrophota bacterium]
MRSKKIISLLTGIFFTLNQMAIPAQGLAAVSPVSVSEVQVQNSFQLEIPAELGTVETLYTSQSSFQSSLPTIIHIQEAHGNPEVQKKIAEILQYLKNQYGTNLLLLEGNARKLEPERIQFFPGNPETTRKVVEQLAGEGIVTGPELFFLDEPQAEAYGIENAEAYRQNANAFAAVLKARGQSQNFLNNIELQIERLTSPYLNKDLRHFLKRLDMDESHQIPFEDWLGEIKSYAKKYLETDLENPFFQREWPMLLRLFTLKRLESELDMSGFEKEREVFAGFLQGFSDRGLSAIDFERIIALLNAPLSQNILPAPETSRLFERMVDVLPKDFDYKAYPNVNRFIGHLILQSELKGDELIQEVDALTDRISDELAAKPREKEIVKLLKDYRLFKKLFALELTPEEYEQIEGGRLNYGGQVSTDWAKRPVPVLFPSALIEKFLALNSDNRVKNTEFENLKTIDELFNKALGFYRGAKERDGLMLENIEKQLNDKVAVVITGGFHSGPFRKYFENKNYNYALITPKMTGTQGRDNYVNMMLESYGDRTKVSPSTTRLPEWFAGDGALKHPLWLRESVLRAMNDAGVTDTDANDWWQQFIGHVEMRRDREVAFRSEIRPQDSDEDVLQGLKPGEIYLHPVHGKVQLLRVFRQEDKIEIKRFDTPSSLTDFRHAASGLGPNSLAGEKFQILGARGLIHDKRFVRYYAPQPEEKETTPPKITQEAEDLIAERARNFVPDESFVPILFGLDVVSRRILDEYSRSEESSGYYKKTYDRIAHSVLGQDFQHPWTYVVLGAIDSKKHDFFKKLFLTIYEETGEDVVLTGVLESFGREESAERQSGRTEIWKFSSSGEEHPYANSRTNVLIGRGRRPAERWAWKKSFQDISSDIDFYYRSRMLSGLRAFNTPTEILIDEAAYQAIRHKYQLHLADYYPKRMSEFENDPFSRLMSELTTAIRVREDFQIASEIQTIVRPGYAALNEKLSEVDLVVPAPSIHLFGNQAIPLADLTAREIGQEMDAFALKQIRARKKQRRQPDLWRRAKNAGGLFKGDPERLKGKVVLIVDDNVTTGFTATAMAAAAYDAGAKKVFVLAYGQTVYQDSAALTEEESLAEVNVVDTGLEPELPSVYTVSDYAKRLFDSASSFKKKLAILGEIRDYEERSGNVIDYSGFLPSVLDDSEEALRESIFQQGFLTYIPYILMKAAKNNQQKPGLISEKHQVRWIAFAKGLIRHALSTRSSEQGVQLSTKANLLAALGFLRPVDEDTISLLAEEIDYVDRGFQRRAEPLIAAAEALGNIGAPALRTFPAIGVLIKTAPGRITVGGLGIKAALAGVSAVGKIVSDAKDQGITMNASDLTDLIQILESFRKKKTVARNTENLVPIDQTLSLLRSEMRTDEMVDIRKLLIEEMVGSQTGIDVTQQNWVKRAFNPSGAHRVGVNEPEASFQIPKNSPLRIKIVLYVPSKAFGFLGPLIYVKPEREDDTVLVYMDSRGPVEAQKSLEAGVAQLLRIFQDERENPTAPVQPVPPEQITPVPAADQTEPVVQFNWMDVPFEDENWIPQPIVRDKPEKDLTADDEIENGQFYVIYNPHGKAADFRQIEERIRWIIAKTKRNSARHNHSDLYAIVERYIPPAQIAMYLPSPLNQLPLQQLFTPAFKEPLREVYEKLIAHGIREEKKFDDLPAAQRVQFFESRIPNHPSMAYARTMHLLYGQEGVRIRSENIDFETWFEFSTSHVSPANQNKWFFSGNMQGFLKETREHNRILFTAAIKRDRAVNQTVLSILEKDPDANVLYSVGVGHIIQQDDLMAGLKGRAFAPSEFTGDDVRLLGHYGLLAKKVKEGSIASEDEEKDLIAKSYIENALTEIQPPNWNISQITQTVAYVFGRANAQGVSSWQALEKLSRAAASKPLRSAGDGPVVILDELYRQGWLNEPIYRKFRSHSELRTTGIESIQRFDDNQPLFPSWKNPKQGEDSPQGGQDTHAEMRAYPDFWTWVEANYIEVTRRDFGVVDQDLIHTIAAQMKEIDQTIVDRILDSGITFSELHDFESKMGTPNSLINKQTVRAVLSGRRAATIIGGKDTARPVFSSPQARKDWQRFSDQSDPAVSWPTESTSQVEIYDGVPSGVKDALGVEVFKVTDTDKWLNAASQEESLTRERLELINLRAAAKAVAEHESVFIDDASDGELKERIAALAQSYREGHFEEFKESWTDLLRRLFVEDYRHVTGGILLGFPVQAVHAYNSPQGALRGSALPHYLLDHNYTTETDEIIAVMGKYWNPAFVNIKEQLTAIASWESGARSVARAKDILFRRTELRRGADESTVQPLPSSAAIRQVVTAHVFLVMMQYYRANLVPQYLKGQLLYLAVVEEVTRQLKAASEQGEPGLNPELSAWIDTLPALHAFVEKLQTQEQAVELVSVHESVPEDLDALAAAVFLGQVSSKFHYEQVIIASPEAVAAYKTKLLEQYSFGSIPDNVKVTAVENMAALRRAVGQRMSNDEMARALISAHRQSLETIYKKVMRVLLTQQNNLSELLAILAESLTELEVQMLKIYEDRELMANPLAEQLFRDMQATLTFLKAA